MELCRSCRINTVLSVLSSLCVACDLAEQRPDLDLGQTDLSECSCCGSHLGEITEKELLSPDYHGAAAYHRPSSKWLRGSVDGDRLFCVECADYDVYRVGDHVCVECPRCGVVFRVFNPLDEDDE